MADTVKVPGIKKPLPKAAVIGGLAVTGIAIVWYYRKNHSASPPAATATDQYPPDGTMGNPQDPYSTDPATGQTYGNEAAGSGTFGGFGTAPADTGSSSGGSSGGGGQTSEPHGGPPFGSNDEWARYAEAHVHVKGTAEAVGLYLNGRVLDAAQADIIYQAIAVAGPVPADGPGGYPPKLRTASPGHKGGREFAVNPVRGLRETHRAAHEITIGWDKADHATGYQVSLYEAGKKIRGPFATPHLTFTFHTLKASTRYRAHVLAKPAEKGARTAITDVRTAG